MQLSLKIIDSDCNPLAGAQVDIWHCDHRGVYSGDSSASDNEPRFNRGFCTGGDEAAQSQSWGRGGLVSDARGRVDFKSVFPGWYPGRPIHIHFTVKVDGNTSLVSQLYFEASLCENICLGHPQYAMRGLPDANFLHADETDASSEKRTQLLNTRTTEQGTLQAYKLIKIISS